MVLRLCHLITSLEGGGSEHYLYQLLAHSPPDVSHSVFYLKRAGVIAQRLEKIGITPRRASPLSLWNTLQRDRPDVLHTLLYRAHQIGRVIGTIAGVPQIVSSQQSIDRWQNAWHRALDSWTLRLCDTVLVNSLAAESLVKSRLAGRAAPRVLRVANGLDRFPRTDFDRASARAKWGIPAEVPVGATLMRLHPEKGADLLGGFAGAALRANPGLHLLVAGVGPLDRELRLATSGQRWSDRLHWLGWQEDVGRVLQSADFFFSLSREESFPQALVEAASFGLPWIAPSVGGIPELLAEGSAGALYPKENIRAAEQAVTQLLAQLPERRRQAQAAAGHLQELHSLQQMVDATYAAFSGRPTFDLSGKTS